MGILLVFISFVLGMLFQHSLHILNNPYLIIFLSIVFFILGVIFTLINLSKNEIKHNYIGFGEISIVKKQINGNMSLLVTFPGPNINDDEKCVNTKLYSINTFSDFWTLFQGNTDKLRESEAILKYNSTLKVE